MQSPLITQNDYLTEKQLNNLATLAGECHRFDGVESKIYWDIIQHKRDIAGNFLYYQQDKLIGYFSFFLFDEDAVHVSAMVHPDDRHQGIFLRLLHAACPEIVKLGINKIIFSFPEKNQMAKKCLIALAGNFLHFEYRMERLGYFSEIITNNKLSVKKADDSDIELMAKTDSACFNSDHDTMLQRVNYS